MRAIPIDKSLCIGINGSEPFQPAPPATAPALCDHQGKQVSAIFPSSRDGAECCVEFRTSDVEPHVSVPLLAAATAVPHDGFSEVMQLLELLERSSHCSCALGETLIIFREFPVTVVLCLLSSALRILPYTGSYALHSICHLAHLTVFKTLSRLGKPLRIPCDKIESSSARHGPSSNYLR